LPDGEDKEQLFDTWPEAYDRWFTTPIGTLVKKYESELLLDLLRPRPGEVILDGGSGTGIFTLDLCALGTRVIGLDLSRPMLLRARRKAAGCRFEPVVADMACLPFHGEIFDRTVSVTALEFIQDGEGAVREFFRVTKAGGAIVVATLNRLSPWASRRKAEAEKGHPLFQKVIFRSPDELASLAPIEGDIETAIHFQKDEAPEKAPGIEADGRTRRLLTGAFVAVRWVKPGRRYP